MLQSIEEDLKGKLVDHSDSTSQDDSLEKPLSDARKVIVINKLNCFCNSSLTQSSYSGFYFNNYI